MSTPDDPSQTFDDMAQVFDALGHPTRRRILDLLRRTPGMAVGVLAEHFAIGRIAVMHHLRQLEVAGLVVSLKEGRVRRLFQNPVPIQLIQDRWSTEYGSFWAGKMADVKYAIESRHTHGGEDGGTRTAGLEGDHSRSDRGRVA